MAEVNNIASAKASAEQNVSTVAYQAAQAEILQQTAAEINQTIANYTNAFLDSPEESSGAEESEPAEDFGNEDYEGEERDFSENPDDETLPTRDEEYTREISQDNSSLTPMTSNSKDMYSALQEAAFARLSLDADSRTEPGKKSASELTALNRKSFSLLIALINNLDQWGFLSEPLDKEEINGQLLCNDDYIIHNFDNFDYQFISDNIEQVNKYILFEIKLDELSADVKAAFRALASFKPDGIGSRSMKEYLITMAKGCATFPDWGQEIFKNHYEQLFRQEKTAIAKALGRSVAEIDTALLELKNTLPYPAAYFNFNAAYVEPEIRIFFNSDKNKFDIEWLAENTIQPICFKRSYLDLLLNIRERDQKQNHPGETKRDQIDINLNLRKQNITAEMVLKNFVTRERQNREAIQADIAKLAAANPQMAAMAKEAYSYITQLATRQRIILGAAQSLIKCQEAFLLSGNKFDLRPMLQKEAATDIGVDPSQFSRAIRDKFIEICTAKGTIVRQLSDFFGMPDSNSAIQEIIGGEDSANPLSDNDIVKMLKEKYNINIQRPAVAKARNKLGIPSAGERKVCG